ncbi:MAG: hypothetical protein HKN47_18805, partial [Pirellulaceae bacterium]|nr:hypothetical protein [Pirellulaceae bacterium]
MLFRVSALLLSMVIVHAVFAQSGVSELDVSVDEATVETTTSTDNQIRRWVEQLDSPKFSERMNATRQLERAGAAAIKSLERVVINGRGDAADRALELLKKNFESGSPALSEPSRAALKRIASDENHPLADAAEKVIAPVSEPPASANRKAVPRLMPPPRIPGQIKAQAKIRITMRSVNGKRDISVEQDGRKFRFRDSDNGIRVDRPDGNGGVKTTQYKNADELKKADAEAYGIYQQYGKNHIQLRFNGAGGLPQGIQVPGIQVPGIQVPGMPPNFQIPAFPQPGIQPFPRRTLPSLQ